MRLVSFMDVARRNAPASGAPQARRTGEARTVTSTSIPQPDVFTPRHLGPSDSDVEAMLKVLGYPSLDALIDATVPGNIRFNRPLTLPAALSEQDALAEFKAMVAQNQVWRSFIGLGYYGTHTPAVIQRNILENPGWYTAYTPYQAEIAQGRLEALLNFQTMVIDLTGLPIANASLLDEGTAAAEAMAMSLRPSARSGTRTSSSSPTTAIRRRSTSCRRAPRRAASTVDGRRPAADARSTPTCSACWCSIPTPTARCVDYRALVRAGARGRRAGHRRRPTCWRSRCSRRRANGAPTSRSATRSASACRWATAARTPRSSRRGTSSSASMPGRIIGVSRDAQRQAGAAHGAADARAAHPPREGDEQHLHGAGAARGDGRHVRGLSRPDGLTRIATRVHRLADDARRRRSRKLGHAVAARRLLRHGARRRSGGAAAGRSRRAAARSGSTCACSSDGTIGVSLDETTTRRRPRRPARRSSRRRARARLDRRARPSVDAALRRALRAHDRRS